MSVKKYLSHLNTKRHIDKPTKVKTHIHTYIIMDDKRPQKGHTRTYTTIHEDTLKRPCKDKLKEKYAFTFFVSYTIFLNGSSWDRNNVS